MAFNLFKPSSPSRSIEDEFENLVADFLRERGWRVKKESLSVEKGVDIIAVHGSKRCIFQCKTASEGRQDRLVPLLSQAILQACAYAQASPKPSAPLAVVAAPSISLSAVNSLVSFRSQFAPDVAIGIIDREGLRKFMGPGLENLNASPPRRIGRQKLPSLESAYLFPISASGRLRLCSRPSSPRIFCARRGANTVTLRNLRPQPTCLS